MAVTTTSRDEDEISSGRSRRRWLIGAVALACSTPIIVRLLGCGKYPIASSVESYALMEGLYTACNTRNPEWLARAEKRVDRAVQEGSMSPAEQEAFQQIINWAKAGEWERAQKAAYKFAADQAGRGVTNGGSHGHGKQAAAKGK